ncbi:MAG: TolB family protein [Pyrinomonadaceae bacterium]
MTIRKLLLVCVVLATILPWSKSFQDVASQSRSNRDWEKGAIQQWTVERRTGNQISIELKPPPYVRRLTYFGERADWSHDGKRILFLEKTFGDVFEIELTTGVIRPITHHYVHEGYTRALYLADGNILLSGAREFSAQNPSVSRMNTAELWVLDKALDKPPVPLGERCFEGPAVSRTQMRIAWTVHHENYPDKMPEGVCQFWIADIENKNGGPRFVNKRKILDSRDLAFRLMETQNFRPPEEKELTFIAAYQGGDIMGLNLETGKTLNYTNTPGQFEEPEGIFPDGQYTTMETNRSEPGRNIVDIWKLKLDGSNEAERLTYFSTGHSGYRATNPVISEDGRFMAFQLAKDGEPTGVGHGIFIYDFEAAKKFRVQ